MSIKTKLLATHTLNQTDGDKVQTNRVQMSWWLWLLGQLTTDITYPWWSWSPGWWPSWFSRQPGRCASRRRASRTWVYRMNPERSTGHNPDRWSARTSTDNCRKLFGVCSAAVRSADRGPFPFPWCSSWTLLSWWLRLLKYWSSQWPQSESPRIHRWVRNRDRRDCRRCRCRYAAGMEARRPRPGP